MYSHFLSSNKRQCQHARRSVTICVIRVVSILVLIEDQHKIPGVEIHITAHMNTKTIRLI